MGSRLLYVIGVILGDLLAATALTLRRAYYALFANRWPTTEAVVQHVTAHDPEKGICAVRVEYEYYVNGAYFYGQISHECLLPVFARKFASHFVARATYLVHYSQGDPRRSYMPSRPMLVRLPSAAASA